MGSFQQGWARSTTLFARPPRKSDDLSSMALRYADETAPINQWRSSREPLDAFATFSGFSR
jgi:hypothetical protein